MAAVVKRGVSLARELQPEGPQNPSCAEISNFRSAPEDVPPRNETPGAAPFTTVVLGNSKRSCNT